MGDILEFLRKIPVFEDLSEIDLNSLKDIIITRTYGKNEIIFMEGDRGEGIYFIFNGKVKLSKMSYDGREHILNIFGSGDIFAEVMLFNNITYPATAESIEQSEIAMIRTADMEKLVLTNSKFALKLISILSRRLQTAQSKVKELALHDTYIRTAMALLKLGRQYGKRVKDGVELDLNISRQELANLVGTTRETVSRALGTFKKEGAILLDQKNIIITDEEKLEEWIINE